MTADARASRAPFVAWETGRHPGSLFVSGEEEEEEEAALSPIDVTRSRTTRKEGRQVVNVLEAASEGFAGRRREGERP